MSAPATRLVLVDRDGVINRDSDQYIKSADEWVPLPGSLEAIARLTQAGFAVVVITNQSGIGRGLFSREALEGIHERMRSAIAEAGGSVAGIYICPHKPDDGCKCRKPQPGLLLEASRDFGVALDDVAFIGDKQSDIGAAVAAGARPVFIGSEAPAPDIPVFADLADAADALINERSTH